MKRCVFITQGFYEWKHGILVEPHFISKTGRLNDQPPVMLIAGVYLQNEYGHSCAIITTDANEQMTKFHDRMPAILDDYRDWLFDKCAIKSYKEELEIVQVSKAVNKVGPSSPNLIKPVKPQKTLMAYYKKK